MGCFEGLVIGAFLIMFFLKLNGTIEYSWWIVCSPLIAYAGLVVILVVLTVLIMIIHDYLANR